MAYSQPGAFARIGKQTPYTGPGKRRQYKTREELENSKGRDWINAVVSRRGTTYAYVDGVHLKTFFIPRNKYDFDRPEAPRELQHVPKYEYVSARRTLLFGETRTRDCPF